MHKYMYYKAKNKIIAVSTYAGKVVRGVAKCNPEDEFDLRKGEELASARCNVKVANKRYKNALKKREEALKKLTEAKKRYEDMNTYVFDSAEAIVKANAQVDSILKGL